MRPRVDRAQAILALQRVIVATFDRTRWMELAYLTSSVEVVERHPRLLRSLNWDDDDYGGRVFEVLPTILGPKLKNLPIVEEYTGAEQWLVANDPELHARVYGADGPRLNEVEEAAEAFGVPELRRHAARLRAAVLDDPEQAVGSAKELLETALRAVLDLHGHGDRSDLPALMKLAQRRLKLESTAAEGSGQELAMRKRTLNNLFQLVVGVAELRNLYGTGHGRSRSHVVDRAHARLVVDAALAIATYLLDLRRSVAPAASTDNGTWYPCSGLS